MKLDLSYEYKEMSEGERKDYCSAIFAVIPRLEKDIKEKMYEQLVNTYSVAVGSTRSKDKRDFEIVRGNGVMEGMAILLENWKAAANEHVSSNTAESFNKNSPISEV